MNSIKKALFIDRDGNGGVRPSDTPMLNLPTSPCQTMKSGNLMKKAFQGK